MFLLPCLLLGLVFAVVLGGRLSRLGQVQFRLGWTVFLALGVQIALFSSLGEGLDEATRGLVHVGSYGILFVFAVANMRLWTLAPVLLGMLANGAAIVANGGKMPVSPEAARAVGLEADATANVSEHAQHLRFLGDVFALPSPLPLANVFSVGDLLIGFGMAAFVIYVSLADGEDAGLSPRRLLEPLRASAYRRLAAGKLASQIGDWLTLAALIGWLYGETTSTEHVAALLLVRLAPPILGGSLAALLVDRLPKRGLLVWVEGARGLAVAVALGGVLTGELVAVYAALALSGGLAAMSSAAVPALVPSLLPDEQLPSANAGLGMTKDAAMALGAFGAGVALSSVGVAVALVVDLATFVVAMVLFLGLRLPAAADPGRDPDAEPRGSGLRYVLSRRRLLVLVASFAAATLATGLTNASLPRFLEGAMDLGPGGYGFGIAALAAGLLAGEALVGFSRVGPNAGRWIGVGLLLMAGLFGLLGSIEHAPTALLLLGLIGFVDGTTDVLFETTAQREADPRYYGSVFGFASALMATTMTGAFVAAPALNGILDPEAVILGAGVVLAAAGLIALVGMHAGRRGQPEAAPRATVSLVAWGDLVPVAECAARAIADELDVEVVPIAAPLQWAPEDVLASVRRTSRVAVLHGGNGSTPAAAELAATIGELAFPHLRAPVVRIVSGEAVLGLRRLAAL